MKSALLLLSVVVLSSCSSSSVSAGPSPQPGLPQASPVTALRSCTIVAAEGARVTEEQVVDGCIQNDSRVILKAVRCRDGRTYLTYGTRFKGIVGGVWHDVGPGHGAVARRFQRC